MANLKDYQTQVEQLLRDDEQPSADACRRLCEALRDTLVDEPNCLFVACPVTIVGDLHGQFPDLKELLSVTGPPPETNFLFLGDFVDRGKSSVKTVALVFLLKLVYPGRVFLIRGNHECRAVSQVYGFYDECLRIYGTPSVWQNFTDTFDTLPLTAIIDGRAFCTHAGLSPHISTIDEIQSLERFCELPHSGAVCDLLWSDPVEDTMGWCISRRGAGYEFGKDISEKFIHDNGLEIIVRAHQLVMDGYEWCHDKNVVTVFSAPNYCNRCGNYGAIMNIDEHFQYSFIKIAANPESEPLSPKGVLPLPDNFERRPNDFDQRDPLSAL